MINRGSKPWWLAMALLVAVGPMAEAALKAEVDRQQVSYGDSLRLTITSDGDTRLDDLPLQELARDFDILQRSTSSQVNLINGRRTTVRQTLLDLMPRREGTAVIPPLRAGSEQTAAIRIEVMPAAQDDSDGQQILFEAELDRDSTWVQGQVLLTLRLQQAIQLESRSITEVQLDKAYVTELGQHSYQRQRNGHTWLVHEVRYAIFPEQSGTLEIPAQVFNAVESDGRLSAFPRNRGRRIQRQSEPLTVNVLPRPAAYPATTWLPARDLRIEENWSTPPEALRAGESATRTLRLVGEGLQGAQLPPLQPPRQEGLKAYPDQPRIDNREKVDGLVGIREESAALVPTRAGVYRLPEIRIPWWDVDRGELREAVVPARTVRVAPGASPVETPQAPPAPQVTPTPETAGAPLSQAPSALPWQIATAVLAAAWLATMIWARLGGRALGGQQQSGATRRDVSPGEARAWRDLLAACASNRPAAARQALLTWATTLDGQAPRRLADVAAHFGDEPLAAELAALDAALYASDADEWRGEALTARLKILRKRRPGTTAATARLALYPEPRGT